MSTITAIATPNAVGGISVIRISGENAISISDKIFKGVGEKKVCEMKGYTCAYGTIFSGDRALDDVVLTVFKAPRSYTGEDVIEISCHGGIYVTRQVLRTVLENGAKLAEAGEFTKLAFLNGKLSLTQAEAVMDVISANSKNELKYASALKDGAVFRRIKKICDKIIRVLSDLSVWADYPEDDIPEINPKTLLISLENIRSDLKLTADTYDYGRIIRNGINTAIVGKPNVGKSTLMNYLSGFERSIVTDIEGTTRDVIEESVKIGELTLRLSDTAGIRNTDDVIESMGVDIAYKRLNEADLVIAVFDNTRPLSQDDIQIIKSLKNKKTIAVINKIDGENVLDKTELSTAFENIVEISVKTGDGTEKLAECLNNMFLTGDIEAEQGILANERQKMCLENALSAVDESITVLENGENLDALTIVLDEAANYLLELTGEKATNAVVDEVFSRFCVGK